MKSSLVKKFLKKRRNHQSSKSATKHADGTSCTSAALEEATASQDEGQQKECHVELRNDEGVPKYVQMTFTSPQQKQKKSHSERKPSLPESSPDDSSRSSTRPESIAKAAAALDNYGNDQFEQGEYEVAMVSYSRALKLKERTLQSLPSDHDTPETDAVMASVATSINNIGYLKQRSGATAQETMSAYQDSLRIKQEILGRDSLGCGKTLNNIGSVYFLTKDYPNAMKAYQEACNIMIYNLGPNHIDVATVYSNMGDVHLAQNNSDRACDLYRQALTIRWEQLGERDNKVVRLLEKVALIEMGELDQVEIGVQTSTSEVDEEDEDKPVDETVALDNLMNEVKRDMNHVDSVKRQLALDMVKEKVQMKREMRAINDGIDDMSDSLSTASRPTPSPLTPDDRAQALAALKGRLRQIRESKRNLVEDLDKVADDENSISVINNRSVDDGSRDHDVVTTERQEDGKENVDIASGTDSTVSMSRALERHAKATEIVRERLEKLQATSVGTM